MSKPDKIEVGQIWEYTYDGRTTSLKIVGHKYTDGSEENWLFDNGEWDWEKTLLNNSRYSFVGYDIPDLVVKSPGSFCCECKNFTQWAEANLGDKFLCWGCKDSYGWKYEKI